MNTDDWIEFYEDLIAKHRLKIWVFQSTSAVPEDIRKKEVDLLMGKIAKIEEMLAKHQRKKTLENREPKTK